VFASLGPGPGEIAGLRERFAAWLWPGSDAADSGPAGAAARSACWYFEF